MSTTPSPESSHDLPLPFRHPQCGAVRRSDIAAYHGLVSVITPVHNEPEYLRRCIQSVMAQTVAVAEHIIIDDGSSDHTGEVLAQLKGEYPHVVAVFQPREGAAAARNAGIALAQGRYIAFLDADDVWHERKLEKQIRFMEEEGVSFSYGDYVEVHHYSMRITRRYSFPGRVTHADLMRGCPIGCLTAVYNQETLGKRYMPTTRTGHDWALWLELTRDGTVARKYPGMEASYSNGRSSLSSRKLQKFWIILQLYHRQIGASRSRALLLAIGHAVRAIFKRIRMLY